MPERLPSIPPLLTAGGAEKIIAAVERGARSVEVSLDLNVSTETVDIEGGRAILRSISLEADRLARLLKRQAVAFAVTPEGIEPVECREGGYAKLVPTDGAPTVELSGVRMHRTAGIDPFEDARTKVAAVVRSGDDVLDTCGGLGYTAVWARRLGAGSVVSVEVNPAVLGLRRMNPWSREYLEDDAIRKLEGDIADLIAGFESGSFSTILHDPPRFSLAGHLYGTEFIGEMRRVLRPGGRLMFYTGEPYRRGRGRDFVAGVGRRLRDAGFRTEWKPDIQAFVAVGRR